MSTQHEVADPPSDVISSVRVSPDASHILVGSWDGYARIYTRNEHGTFIFSQRFVTAGPILDVCWASNGKHVFWVGLDKAVRRLELTSDATSADQVILSLHDAASNKIAYSAGYDVLISTSWDATMHVHDPKSGAFVRIKLAAKPFALSLSTERAVVGMAERKVAVYELSALKQLLDQSGNVGPGQTTHELQPWQERESSLKFMTRAIVCMPDGTGFATSSIEGRVGVEWFDPDVNNQSKYAFKCHRQSSTTVNEEGEEEDVDIVYPVNALAFHPVHGTFATGGGDGVVALWDANTKRRVKQFQKLGASVAAIDFSSDGKFLAIGVSPGFEDGFEEEEAVDPTLVKVVVRELADGDIKAKASK